MMYEIVYVHRHTLSFLGKGSADFSRPAKESGMSVSIRTHELRQLSPEQTCPTGSSRGF